MGSLSMDEDTPTGRQWNRLRVIEALYRRPASRTDLARRTGLSRPTVSSLVEELTQMEIVQEHAAPDSPQQRSAGRPPQLLSLVRDAAFAIGLDFGHDHVRIAVCDLSGEIVIDDCSVAAVDHAPTPSFDLAQELVRDALTTAGIDEDRILGIGMGLAAPVNRSTGSIESEGFLPGWHGLRPAEEMEARLGFPVELENDANLGALGEREFGCGRDAQNMIYIRLSTGIGAGLIIDGRPFRGTNGIAGEIGHFADATDGLICRCGNRGCLETTAGPVALASLLEKSLNVPVSIQDLLDFVTAGDRGARRLVTDAGVAVGRALAAAINLINPELVVVGGHLAGAGDVLLDAIRSAIAQHAIQPAADALRVIRGDLGDRAEVLGGAALILTQSPLTLLQQFEAH
jgi:predicted NBD/HSP70 family sugar kinase